MPPRIAIPLPHSSDPDYNRRALPQYVRAVELAGGRPIPIPLDMDEAEDLAASCDAVLLPGSNADVDPQRFSAPRSSHAAPVDALRERVDNLLLDDAYRARRPVLGICYGLQSLNVYRGGSLIQHIPDFLPEDVRAKINHEAGRAVSVAHHVRVESGTRLSNIVAGNFAVNSSHHQSVEKIGEGLRVTAECPDDGIVEAVEGTDPLHFVLAVQWHPERSVDEDEHSRAIFRAFVAAATQS